MDTVEARFGLAVIAAGGAGAARYLQSVVYGELPREAVTAEWAWPAGRVVL